ncbi:hypothetical protein [Thiocystis violascens]|uniref:Uncharacterized protein n=1 Tax=Thiocystis violascens (strain ATCC 17096 / DSM 198 / 6111) TaxID=765911 RepID=I3YGT0_THIV6|nr:hypothetical protein [Thiocystis violascens]AFL76198.1 hypothetical protein Thivi_4395 [Thiocystis violascens DSM 198]
MPSRQPTAQQFDLIRTLAVAGELARRGCRVLDAQVLPHPRVRISAPPPGLLPTFGFLPPPPGVCRVPVLCVAHRWRTRIEWFATEGNQ